MFINYFVIYSLVDDEDKEGGMFFSSAYEHFNNYQNHFINDIICEHEIDI